MRRLLVLAAAGAMVGAAFLIPAPDPAPEPLQGLVIEAPGLSSPEDASIWYCPWAQSDASRDSVFGVASLAEATAAFTLPVAVPGQPADSVSVPVTGRGAATLALNEVAQRGDSPGFVEFDGGPAAVSVTVMGEGVLAADACLSSGPQVWHFPGGSTMPDEHLTLRIFNPFPEPAKVTVTGVSDIGVEVLGELEGLAVGARSWRDVEFESLLRQRQNLVITVTAVDGVVVPAMVLGNEADEDWWPGVGEATEWEFPVARVADTEGYLVVHNPGLGPVEVSVDLFTADGPVIEAFTATVTADSPARFDLSAYPGDSLAARVVASGPVAAAVVALGEAEVAVMPGAAGQASTWLLPGLRRLPLHAASIWLLNTSSEDSVSATVSPLGGGGLGGETVVVAPGVPRQVDVTVGGAEGFLVEASSPLTVAWSVRGPSGLAFALASPVAEPGAE
ncbi:MAG TPA: DUF5719 family protein [Acidimicrobiia bacterium]|nr:DUF5719 family protein [Acidimicrobiia bacterium]